MISKVHRSDGSVAARLPRTGKRDEVLRFVGRNRAPSDGGPYACYLHDLVARFGTRRVMHDDFAPPRGWTWPEYARARGWRP